jgi:hypothetical protein
MHLLTPLSINVCMCLGEDTNGSSFLQCVHAVVCQRIPAC